MTPYLDWNGCTLYVGDALTVLRELPSGSVQCCVTSPPYYGLRDYNVAGQIGLEPTPDAYIAALVAVFAQVRRVLRDDGVCWLNIGDSFANDAKWGGSTGGKHVAALHGNTGVGRARTHTGAKPKDLLLIPFRLALALQAEGWYVRSDIIWYKRNCMPESVTDRPTTAHEHVFLLAKAERYFYDADAVRETAIHEGRLVRASGTAAKNASGATETNDRRTAAGFTTHDTLVSGRNLRSVWDIPPQPFTAARLGIEDVDHFAAFPIDLPLRCLRAGTSDAGACAACGAPYERVTERHAEPKAVERLRNVGGRTDGYTRTRASGGLPPVSYDTTGWRPTCRCADPRPPVPCVALDPFGGSGTTALAAQQIGRRSVLVDLNPEYARIIEARVARQGVLDFADGTEAAS